MPELPTGWSEPNAGCTRLIRERLPSLTDRQRQVALQFYFEGRTKPEIAESMGGISLHRVKMILRAIDRACDRHGHPRFIRPKGGRPKASGSQIPSRIRQLSAVGVAA